MDFGIKNNAKEGFSFGGNNAQSQNQQPAQPQGQVPQFNQPQGQQGGQHNQQQSQEFQQNNNYQQQGQQQSQQQNNQPQYNQQPQQHTQQSGYQQPPQQQFNQPAMQQHPASTGVCLQKGQKVSLTKMNSMLDNIHVGLGWDVAQQAIPHDLDVEVFMLGQGDKVMGDDWFVFYNKVLSPDGSVKHSGDNTSGAGMGDDEVVNVQLSRVSPQVTKLVFVVTINDALQKNHNFGQISNAYIRVVDQSTGRELIRYSLNEYYPNVISMVVGEIYRANNEWKFNPVGDGTGDDLFGLCARYGVNVG